MIKIPRSFQKPLFFQEAPHLLALSWEVFSPSLLLLPAPGHFTNQTCLSAMKKERENKRAWKELHNKQNLHTM